jgi:hypothetical protein
VARRLLLKSGTRADVGERLLSSKLQILSGTGSRCPSLALSILTGRVAEQLSVLENFYAGECAVVAETPIVPSSTVAAGSATVASRPAVTGTATVASHPTVADAAKVASRHAVADTAMVASRPAVADTAMVDSRPAVAGSAKVRSRPAVADTAMVASHPAVAAGSATVASHQAVAAGSAMVGSSTEVADCAIVGGSAIAAHSAAGPGLALHAEPAHAAPVRPSRPHLLARTVYLTEAHVRDVEAIIEAWQPAQSRRVTRSAVLRIAIEHLRDVVNAEIPAGERT